MNKVALLFGGQSAERDVSLATGAAVSSGLKDAGYSVTEFEIAEADIISHVSELRKFDMVFIGYHGGFGENGHVQAVLEMANIKFTGSDSFSSALAMDKEVSRLIMADGGIPVADAVVVRSSDTKIDMKSYGLRFPLAVKPVDGGSTIGFTKIEKPEQLEDAIDKALQYSGRVIVENFIDGIELTVSFLGQDILPPIFIEPVEGFYDYDHKYKKGLTRYHCPAPLEDETISKLNNYTQKAIYSLGCRNYGRVEFRMDKEGNLFCLELNTLPGMTDLSLVPMAAKAVGLDFPSLLDKIVRDAFNYFS